jgi:hypothetical protein
VVRAIAVNVIVTCAATTRILTITVTDAIVSTMYTVAVSGSPATIGVGQTATATVTYKSGGTSGSWIANSVGYTITELAAGHLHSSGSPTPAVTIIPHQLPTGAPQGLAVDARGRAPPMSSYGSLRPVSEA